jgi:hypothetical protein
MHIHLQLNHLANIPVTVDELTKIMMPLCSWKEFVAFEISPQGTVVVERQSFTGCVQTGKHAVVFD